MKEALKEMEAKKIIQSIENSLEDIEKGRTHSIDKLWDEL